MTSIIRSCSVKIEEHQKILLRTALALLAISCVLYGYFLRAAITNVINRKMAEQSASALEASLGDLEARSLALRESITPALAAQMGFLPIAKVSFISRNDSGLSLNLR